MRTFLLYSCLICFLIPQKSYAQVPVLNSYPAASAVIFLDFDGHTVNGTSWNYNGPIVCEAPTLNNAQITEIFNRVAEDYRPFNINITTDSTKFLAAPASKRMRVILTITSSWYGSAGGVAFVTSFSWGDDTPCFVFTALLNNNVKYISEAASHEAGHTLGMYHQSSYDANCVKTADYNPGVGSGEIAWAPIMGVGYYRNLTLWNNGPHSFSCTNFQSDLDKITSEENGFGYRTDDHGNLFTSATLSPLSNNEFNASGVIERNTDQDVFSFVMLATGRFQLNAIPYNVGTGNAGSDLDLQVTLYNASETALNVYNPGALLSSVIDTLLGSGTYYLKVEGKGNQYAPSYASLGSYSLQGSITDPTVLPLYQLDLHGELNGDKHQLNWQIQADEKIKQLLIEVSTDGRNFDVLTEVGKNDRSYTYKPFTLNTTQYRLNVIFDNGRRYYSNVITINKNKNQLRPILMTTMTTSKSVQVNSPGNYSYAIIDLNGSIIAMGQLNSGINVIHADRMNKGMYVIRFNDNNRQWTDKFVRQ